MKETILSLHPNFSNSSVNLGKTASLLVVLKAIMSGGKIAFKSPGKRLPKIKNPTNKSTAHKVAIPIIKYKRYLP